MDNIAFRREVLSDVTGETHKSSTPTNVAQVRQLSPFRYPGGKTWLIPEIRRWLLAAHRPVSILVEPFAGGGIAGLTAAAEGLAAQVLLGELDDDVAAVWDTIFHGTPDDVQWLCRRILTFSVTLEDVRAVLADNPTTSRSRAFRTIVKNRMQRGGIMSAGAGLVKAGESGRGLNSRWYPETLVKRIEMLHTLRDRITFQHRDAFRVIAEHQENSDACFFIDPPYTAGGKKAGTRLYTHNAIDHEALFALMARVQGSVLMTYDDTIEVKTLARQYGFRTDSVPMKNTHHAIIQELLVLRP